MTTTVRPEPRYLPAELVMSEMAAFGRRRLAGLGPTREVVLAIAGGAFITAGPLFSLLLAESAATEGGTRLLEGIGFSTGFFFVVLSEAIRLRAAEPPLKAAGALSREADIPTVARRLGALHRP